MPPKNKKSNKLDKVTNKCQKQFTNMLDKNTKGSEDSEEESEKDFEEDSDNEPDIKSTKIKTNNKFSFIMEDSDTETDSESESETETENETKTEYETNIDLDLKKKDINPEKIDNKKEINDKTNGVKLNKAMRDELKKNKKERKEILDIKGLEKLKTIEGVRTIFSDEVEILVNGVKLIGESNITINEKTKYVLIGNNGCGKTTLVKYLYERINDIDDVLMIEQDIQIEDTEQKVCDFILGANQELYTKYLRMKELEKLIDTEQNILLDEYQQLSEEVYGNDWEKFEAESKRILNGLGFTDLNIPVRILSGGWRMRLALGKALLRCPNVLILDEPTNHLDLDAVIWLTDYLYHYKKTLIIITHQIHLMNTIADTIWLVSNPELTGTKVYTIKGNYDKVIKMIENMEREVNKNYEKFTKRVEELRKKSTPKKEVDEFIKKSGIPRPPKPYEVNIDWEKINQLSSTNIIEFRNVDYSYGDKNIFEQIEFSISMGQKLIIVGPNGIGKTTLFKLSSGQLSPSKNNSNETGYIIKDDRLRVGYYHQQIIDNLPLDLTPIQYLQTLNHRLDNGACRGILGKLGIKKTETVDLPNIKINLLSGGQKARVSLSSIQMNSPHLILLDEPTNHLDLESIEGLIKGINEFNGGIVIITHDMYLIESIHNASIYEIKNKKIIKFNGDFSDYCSSILK